MNQIAEKFKERDPTRYFGIVDFVALPENRRPTPPPAPATPPERPRIDVRGSGDPRPSVQLPSVIDSELVRPPPLVPEADSERTGQTETRGR